MHVPFIIAVLLFLISRSFAELSMHRVLCQLSAKLPSRQSSIISLSSLRRWSTLRLLFVNAVTKQLQRKSNSFFCKIFLQELFAGFKCNKRFPRKSFTTTKTSTHLLPWKMQYDQLAHNSNVEWLAWRTKGRDRTFPILNFRIRRLFLDYFKYFT